MSDTDVDEIEINFPDLLSASDESDASDFKTKSMVRDFLSGDRSIFN